jgi:ribosome biogenesis GTPase
MAPEAGLAALGWDDDLARRFAPLAKKHLLPARILSDVRGSGSSVAHDGVAPRTVRLRGALRHQGDKLVVGDWVGLNGEAVEGIVERRTRLIRRAAGERDEAQVIAANIDVVFLVNGLDEDFNPRRMERFLQIAHDSGARPVLVLNKADGVDDLDWWLSEARAVAPGVEVLAVSALTGQGVEAIEGALAGARTGVLVGSSGVGKSTLVNRLLERQAMSTAATRESDGKGRHTTTRRELFTLPNGGLLIDTPGMREVQLWDEGGKGRMEAFSDILALAEGCKFRDCKHAGEPGCAVLAAVEAETLDAARFDSFLALTAEKDRFATAAPRTGKAEDRRASRRRARDRR